MILTILLLFYSILRLCLFLFVIIFYFKTTFVHNIGKLNIFFGNLRGERKGTTRLTKKILSIRIERKIGF